MSIIFSVEEISFNLKEKNKIKRWIKNIIENEGKKLGEISYIFCSDGYLLEINQKYLEHDTYTDIITFDYTENSGIISGDIFVSVDRVGENAREFGVTFDEEMRRVLIHGVLHLLGYPDKKPNEEKKMRQKENEALLLFSKLEIENSK